MIAGEATDARDAAASATRRMGDLQKQLSVNVQGESEITANIEHELARLHAVREQQNHRHGQLSALAMNLRQWIQNNNRRTFDAARTLTVKLRGGENVSQAVTRLRQEIAETKATLKDLSWAEPPRDVLKAEAAAFVARLAEKGAPTVHVDKHHVAVQFPVTADWNTGKEELNRALLAWLDPEQMLSRLESQIDTLPEPKLTMTAEELSRRKEELGMQILNLERSEESLIERAASEGAEILRRPDAAPLAVLGLVAAVKKAKDAA
jgi:hypothetical protein